MHAQLMPLFFMMSLMIDQTIKLKGLDHHVLCPMQCCMNGFVIDDEFLALIPSETVNVNKVCNSFDVTHSIILALQVTRVSYFDVRKPT